MTAVSNVSKTAQGVPLSWPGIPDSARRLLLHGSRGRDHLLAVARRVLSEAASAPADPASLRRMSLLAQNVLLAAWIESPLDGSLAAMLLAQPLPGWPTLPAPVSQLLQAQVNFWSAPTSEHAWWSAPDHGSRLGLVRQGLSAEPKNLFWKLSAWELAWPVADWSLVDEILAEATWPRTLAPLRHRFAAQAFLARGDAHSALASLNAAPMLATLVGDACLRSECLMRLGPAVGADEAAEVLRHGLVRSPWRTSQWLRLFDLVNGEARAALPVPGGAAILLYTFNKARELDETLASLAASDIGEARVWVLDNGSSDGTPGVLATWKQLLGERLTPLRLPVNIGAPAARNWLLSLPEVRRFPYLAFLDDDVALPADWLLKLGAAVTACPEASVWGCRVVDDANPLVAQSVDLTPLPAGEGEQPLVLPRMHLGQPDLGQFSYLRPCVSVTGCCHLLREADIDRTGGFDIRFSPTQFDDLERDLRLGLFGGHAAYQGHLCVRHKRRSGAAAEHSTADIGNATANTHKLLTKYAGADFVRLRERGEALLEADLRRKMERLGLGSD
ncbi:MAG: glycosyltransferase family A protein [Humidesulfovibrio sp.]|nr:glycosyltransferase family A protein [Humidesulfovibrio sp.]